ncbi:non-specific lipid transfer protein GPI-anchored 20-like isoform X2 [Salvia miltiorrhiza]|uniref:non-specific lipid transfer protein GPI-anchored 20-like isoform X2 n=1 Tax=Salvia miltiorrhiza TaxID=226208 RepID=UPI0025ABDE20|nr:non-specific lipid transfer protein GPI-anchored 20-like isoform X2 [Salvia miltiorrhiza]
MAKLKSFECLFSGLCLVSTAVVVQVSSQSSTICSAAMTRSFSSCVSYLTTGSGASSPTEACCSSLKNLMSNGQDCLCLIVTGGAPFQVPLNRPLAMSLPRACKMPGVAVECRDEDDGAPLSSPPSPRGDDDYEELSPASLPPESDVVPEFTPPGMRPTLLPSAALSCHVDLPSLFIMLGVFLFKCY